MQVRSGEACIFCGAAPAQDAVLASGAFLSGFQHLESDG
jgi:hypothetical protein